MIYLIECRREYDTIYKIGRSKNPSRRVKDLSTASDGYLKIIYIYNSKFENEMEKILHRFHSHYKINKEWFNLDMNAVYDFLPLCEKIEKNLDIISLD